jgi:hypothetical protein
VQTQTGWNSVAGNNLFYDANIQMLVNAHSNGIHQAWPGRATRDTVLLSEVVTDLCARVGLEAEDIDVAELTDPVRGFSLARQVSIRGGLELLAVAYNFDGVESDGQLKFTKRGSASIRVITEDELAYVSDPSSPVPELFGETRAQDVDLPARFTVRYNDIERDSDIGVQTVKRIVRPAATMQSQNEATLDLPLVLSAEEAKTIALRQGFAPWIERVHHQWRLPWTHIEVDPGDVVTIALDDGRSFEVRVLKVDIGANLELAWDTVVQESSTYDVAALTSGGLTYRRAGGDGRGFVRRAARRAASAKPCRLPAGRLHCQRRLRTAISSLRSKKGQRLYGWLQAGMMSGRKPSGSSLGSSDRRMLSK